jgi:O-antigen/teichoic acid export membrane protein
MFTRTPAATIVGDDGGTTVRNASNHHTALQAGYLREREDDSAFTRRQLSGLVALLALAEPETMVVPFSGTAVRLRYTGPLERVQSPDRQAPPRDLDSTVAARGRIGMWRFIRSDRMLRSSVFLMLNSGLQAAFGSVFWIVTAHFFDTENVGRASSLISATNLIAILGLLGLNVTFLRYLPVAQQRNRLITSGLGLVGACSGVLALLYILFTPLVARPVAFVAHSLPLAAGFVILTAGVGINGITDSVFIAAGKAGYNALVDGVIGGIAKIVLLTAAVGGGAYGIFCAATGGFTAAAFTSLLLMVIVLHWRPKFGNLGQAIRPVLRFSVVNYLGNVLLLLPGLIVPLIVLNRIGPSAAAYYYVAYQLANLLYQAVFAVEQPFLVEGTQAGAIDRTVLMRSIRVLLALCIPAFTVVILFGHQLLLVFGPKYGSNAGGSLLPLTVALLPIAAGNWFQTILRLSNQFKAILWSNTVFAVVISGLAWVLAPRGLSEMAMAWPIGATASALVAGVAATRTISRLRAPRHRPRHRR